MIAYPIFDLDADVTEIVVSVGSGLVDGGITPSLMEKIKDCALEQGYRVVGHVIYFDSIIAADYGCWSGWVAAFKLERRIQQ